MGAYGSVTVVSLSIAVSRCQLTTDIMGLLYALSAMTLSNLPFWGQPRTVVALIHCAVGHNECWIGPRHWEHIHKFLLHSIGINSFIHINEFRPIPNTWPVEVQTPEFNVNYCKITPRSELHNHSFVPRKLIMYQYFQMSSGVCAKW